MGSVELLFSSEAALGAETSDQTLWMAAMSGKRPIAVHNELPENDPQRPIYGQAEYPVLDVLRLFIQLT
jgi:hypothetical protein